MATDFAQWMAGLEAKRAAKSGDADGIEQLSGRSHVEHEAGSAVKNQIGERTAEANLKELQQEMKLLRWHKLANEAALKAAIIKTKRLKGKDASQAGATRQLEKAAWMQQVIQEEQGKPLEVTEDFIREYQSKEAVEDHRVEKDMKRHLTNLKRVKENFEQRAELYQRNQVYKEKKQLLDRKAQAIANQGGVTGGKTLPPIASAAGLLDVDPSVSVNLQNASSLVSNSGAPLGTGSKNMAKVVNSLDRLMELEKRISLLERDSEDPPAPANRARAAQKAKKVVFAKQRVAASAVEPARTKYHVRVNRKASGIRRDSGGARARGGLADGTDDVSAEGGAFMTSLPAIKSASGAQRDPRKGKSSTLVPYEDRTRGAKSGASRVRGRLHGARQQDEVVGKWMQNRNSATASSRSAAATSRSTRRSRSTSSSRVSATSSRARRSRSTSRSRSCAPGGGAGVKSRALVTKMSGPQKVQSAKDRMREFRDVRKQYDKKREMMMRNLHGKSDGSVRRQNVVRQTNTAARSRQGVKSSRGVVVRGVTRGPARLALTDASATGPERARGRTKTLTGRNSAAVRASSRGSRSTAATPATRMSSHRGGHPRTSATMSRTRSSSRQRPPRDPAHGARGSGGPTADSRQPAMPQLSGGIGLGVVGTAASSGKHR